MVNERIESFTADVILPAVDCKAKVLKKLKRAMPVGSDIKITPTDRTLNTPNKKGNGNV